MHHPRMDPTPDTPFGQIGPDWTLSVFCGCRFVDFIHAYRERHFAPEMTAAQICARLKCERCGERPQEAAWESTHVGRGGLALEARRIRVV